MTAARKPARTGAAPQGWQAACSFGSPDAEGVLTRP